MAKGVTGCYACPSPCSEGLLQKIKPAAFCEFIKLYDKEELLDCLERNEKLGVDYHRKGVNGDYDDFTDIEALLRFIKTGKK